MKVAYQGEPGAYSEQAVNELLGIGERFHAVGYDSFDAAFAATEAGEADFLLAPIENTLGGTIHANCDLQLRHNLCIIGEHNLRVRHCLMALPGTDINDIKKAISHPQALAQVDTYLRKRKIIAEAQYDTAGSAKMIAAQNLVGVAAVASELAAHHYGLDILDRGIEDDTNNYTRFILLRKTPVRLPAGIPAKTSIVFSMQANVAGALFKALSVFALRDIDLSKIESRPCKPDIFDMFATSKSAEIVSSSSSQTNSGGESGKKSSVSNVWMSPTRLQRSKTDNIGSRFKYLFYADLMASVDDPNTANALRHLQEITTFFRVLGSYPRDGLLVGLGSSVPNSPVLSPQGRDVTNVTDVPPMKVRVGILGFGNFGQFLAQKLRAAYDVFGYSRSNYSEQAQRLGVKWCSTLNNF